jgi:hypothetical protein
MTSPARHIHQPLNDVHQLARQVRQVWQDADASGARRPGRPTLARQLDASESQIRQAVATLSTRLAPAPARVLPMPDQGDPTQEIPRVGFDQTGDAGTPGDLPGDAGEPPDSPGKPALTPAPASLAPFPRQWPLILIGLAAAVAVWSGWVTLGRLTGFGVVYPLPGIFDQVKIDTSVLLPMGIEFYAGYALRVWLTSAPTSDETRRFARRSSIAGLIVGAGAQVAAHLMTAASIHTAPWEITAVVACIPVALVGLAAALARLVANDRQSRNSTEVPQ